jgi:hypothetical protein
MFNQFIHEYNNYVAQKEGGEQVDTKLKFAHYLSDLIDKTDKPIIKTLLPYGIDPFKLNWLGWFDLRLVENYLTGYEHQSYNQLKRILITKVEEKRLELYSVNVEALGTAYP